MIRRKLIYLLLLGAIWGAPCHRAYADRTPDPAVLREILLRVDKMDVVDDLRIGVPVRVLEAYARHQQQGEPPKVSDAPVPAVFTQWRAFLDLDHANTGIRVEMNGMVFRASAAEPVDMFLFPANTVYKDLLMNGSPVTPLSRDGWHVVPINEPGPVTVNAQLMQDPVPDGPEKKLVLARHGYVVSSVHIDSDQAFEVTVQGMSRRVLGNAEEGTHGDLALGLSPRATVIWRPRRTDILRKGVASVQPSTAWTIGERILSANARLDVAILGGAIDTLRLRLPADTDNLRLRGPDVKEFQVTGRDLTVFLRGRIRSRTHLLLSFDVARPRGDLVTCPAIAVPGGRVDSGGWVLVANDVGGELLAQDTRGLEQVSAPEVPSDIRGLLSGQPLFFYKRVSHITACAFDHVRTTPFPMVDTIADRAMILTVMRPSGGEMTRAVYRIRNNRAQFLRVRLPQGARLLYAAVEDLPCRVSRDGDHILLPLAKSVQTVEGLISFPVELVYCRQVQQLEARGRRLLDLPEVADVPVALIKVTLLRPETMHIRGAKGLLASVDRFSADDGEGFVFGYGYTVGPQMAEQDMEAAAQRDLAYQYYSAGYEAYRGNRLEEAEEYLVNAARDGRDSSYGNEAEQLLYNIQVGRGDVSGTGGREQRAKVAGIQRGLTGDNPALEMGQYQLIAGGLAMITKGDEEMGLEMLEEAERLGEQLVQRSASKRGQKVVTGQFKHQAEELRQDKKENKALREQLKGYQKKIGDVLLAPVNGAATAVAPSRRFSLALNEAAQTEGLEISELQEAAFGDVDKLAQADPVEGSKVDQRVYASRAGRQGGRSAAPPQQDGPARLPSGGRLKERNLKLRRQVEVLEKAMTAAERPPEPRMAQPDAEQPAGKLSVAQVTEIRKQVARASQQVQGLANRFDQPIALGPGGEQVSVQVDFLAATNQLTSIGNWAMANSATFGANDEAIRKDLAQLQEQIEESQRQADANKAKIQQAGTLIFDVSDVVDKGRASEQRELADFVAANYFEGIEADRGRITVENNYFVVTNTAVNKIILSETLREFQRNDGEVVNIAGVNFELPEVERVPAIGRLFQDQTGTGKRYAVLDEAQYRALSQHGRPADAKGRGTYRWEQDNRDVIVGTGNRSAGQEFTLARSGADFNGLMIDDTEIRLPHNKYLVVDNGDYVTVLKGGEVANWQATDRDIADATPIVPYSMNVPNKGIPVRFEKTFLAAGESADMVLSYTMEKGRIE